MSVEWIIEQCETNTGRSLVQETKHSGRRFWSIWPEQDVDRNKLSSPSWKYWAARQVMVNGQLAARRTVRPSSRARSNTRLKCQQWIELKFQKNPCYFQSWLMMKTSSGGGTGEGGELKDGNCWPQRWIEEVFRGKEPGLDHFWKIKFKSNLIFEAFELQNVWQHGY